MTTYNLPTQQNDYLPISTINTVVYCERRYFIERVLAETLENHHIIEGKALHERTKRDGEGWVWSDKLRIIGIADQIKQEGNQLVPYEIKKGKISHNDSDQVQLCAIALCLEEMYGGFVDEGIIYYHKTRRNLLVAFTPNLREKTLAAIWRIRQINKQHHYPPPTENRHKCSGCSVKDACQPNVARHFAKSR